MACTAEAIVPFARHDDAGQVRIDLPRRLHHGDAVHARHHQVDQQQVERFDGQQG